MEYLLKEDFILINKKTVDRHGGNFVPPQNFLHESDLDYLIEAVESQVFGQPLYPSIADKAGLYMFNVIISRWNLHPDSSPWKNANSGLPKISAKYIINVSPLATPN